MSLAEVKGYLKARLSIDELDEVLGKIELGELDLCQTILFDYLRFDEAEEIMPSIRKVILPQHKGDMLMPEKQESKSNVVEHSKEELLVYIK